MRPRSRFGCALLVVFVTASLAWAQEEKQPPYTEQKAELGFVLTTGNARAQSLSALYDFKRVLTFGEFRLDGSAIRNETRDRVLVGVDVFNQPIFVEEKHVAAEAYGVNAKYRHNLGARLFAYGLGGWARIIQSGLDDRWRAGAGLGFKVIEPQPHKLDFELGAEFTDERYVDGSRADFASLRAFADYDFALSEHSLFSSDLEVLENLDETEDLRLNWISSITAAMTSRVALKVSYLLLFDNQPAILVVAPGPPPVLDEREELDQVFTTSLVVNW
jgi:putative salt-induced outer membrane protein YdiY